MTEWLIRVCKHGYRVEWKERGWLHMDAPDTNVCTDVGPVVVSVIPRSRYTDTVIRAAAESLRNDELDQTNNFGPRPSDVDLQTWHTECLVRHVLDRLEIEHMFARLAEQD